MSDRILTAAQVAEFFQIDRETVYRLAHQGVLPGFKVGYQWRFAESQIQEWYASGAVSTAQAISPDHPQGVPSAKREPSSGCQPS